MLTRLQQHWRGQAQPPAQPGQRGVFEFEVVAQKGRVELEHLPAAQQRHQHRAFGHLHHRLAAMATRDGLDGGVPGAAVVVQTVEVADADVARQ